MPSPDSPGFLIFVNAVNIFTHFLLGTITFGAFSYASNVRNSVSIGIWEVTIQASLSAHIYLCVIGYVILMSQALLVFNPYVGWASYLEKPEKHIVHIVMQVLGSTLAIIGSIIKMADSSAALNSAHAYFGFMTMLLTIFSLFGGIMNFIYHRTGRKNAKYQFIYNCLASVTITMAFIALIIAFDKYYREINADASANLSITFSVFAMVGILTLVYMKVLLKKIIN